MRIPLLFLGLISASVCIAQEKVGVTEITPNVLVFATSTGNVVASVGDDGALLVGTPSAGSTAEISRILAKKTNSHVRYVVIAPQATKDSQGDAGWGRRGAFVAMQEVALGRIGGHVMGAPAPLPPRPASRLTCPLSNAMAQEKISQPGIHPARQKSSFS